MKTYDWQTPLWLALGLCACPAADAETTEGTDGGSDSSTSGDTATTTSTPTSSAASDTATTTAATGDATTDATTAGSGDTGQPADCAAPDTHIERVVCAAEAFKATLSDAENDALLYDFSDAKARTVWSNLPGVARNGLRLGDLDDDSRAAAHAVAQVVLSDAGYADFVGVLAADDYLGAMGGGMGPMGGAYSSDNYYIAFLGAPSTTGDFQIQLGGHHMAYNVTYLGGEGQPTPHHLGSEPKSSFVIDGETYEPLSAEGAALAAMYDLLDAAQLAEAYLDGETYMDVLVGPDNGSGVLPTDYPTGNNRRGVLVGDLSAAQQAAVTAAIAQWVQDYDAEVADPLMAKYTSAEAYADTLIAWAGTENAGVDPDVEGTYMRIDGPDLWIEVACQGGIVIQGQTHYHTIFRDKTRDYGGSL